MSGNKKRITQQDVEMNDSDEFSENDEDDAGNSEAYTGNEEIQVDFEGRNPIDSDFHGIKQLLGQLFLKAQINLGELADIIIGQSYIGSVVQQSETDDIEEDSDDDMDSENVIFGITSAINLTNKQDVPCVQQLIAHILQRAEKNAKDAEVKLLRDILTDVQKHVGFIINERFINIPPQIAVPLLENLHKEITRAATKKMPYNFVYYIMMVKFYRKKAKKNKPQEDLYTNQEEEVIVKNSVAQFEYSVESEKDSGFGGDWLEDDPTMVPYRKIVVFDAKNLENVINSIQQFINQ